VRDQAAAQVRQARATQRETAQLRTRDRELFARGIVSKQELESAVAAAERADAAVSLAVANLRQATATEHVAATHLTKTRSARRSTGSCCRTPSRRPDRGRRLPDAHPVPDRRGSARARALGRCRRGGHGKVREGQVARFTVAAYADRRFDATITTVHNASRVVDRVVSYEAVLASITAHSSSARMTATAEIIVTQLRDELLVASQALRFTRRRPRRRRAPRVAAPAGKPVAVPVTVVVRTRPRPRSGPSSASASS